MHLQFSTNEIEQALIRGEFARIEKHIAINELIFKDHFPQNPVLPVALICQLFCDLIEYWSFCINGSDWYPLIMAMNHCYTYEKLVPPNDLILEIQNELIKNQVFDIKAYAYINKGKIFGGNFKVKLFPSRGFFIKKYK